MLINYLIILLFNMIVVGFYTLMEQKILGYMNNRLGPNKIFFLGLIQFISDFLKLMFKDNIYLLYFNFLSYYLFMYMFFSLSLMMWLFIPLFINLLNLKFMLILILVFFINKILIFIFLVWILNSIYSILSLIRLIIQNLSFEILFMLILFMIMYFIKNFNLIYIYNMIYMSKIFLFSLMILYMWIIIILIELNRMPFDFLESESELISGGNLEFSSINFMILFLIEYLDMILMSFLSLIFFINFLNFFFFFFLLLMMIMLIFIRGFFVRFRMDKMFYLMWKFFFPLLINYLIFMMFMN